jgi:hypothetical protein
MYCYWLHAFYCTLNEFLHRCLIWVMIASCALHVFDLFQHWLEHVFDDWHILYPLSVNLFLTCDWIYLNTINTIQYCFFCTLSYFMFLWVLEWISIALLHQNIINSWQSPFPPLLNYLITLKSGNSIVNICCYFHSKISTYHITQSDDFRNIMSSATNKQNSVAFNLQVNYTSIFNPQSIKFPRSILLYSTVNNCKYCNLILICIATDLSYII